jgi:hypothetical protein
MPPELVVSPSLLVLPEWMIPQCLIDFIFAMLPILEVVC